MSDRIKIVTGLSNDDYHTGYQDYISSTTLKKYQNGGLAFKHYAAQPKTPQLHFIFGSLWHDLISSKHPDGEKLENIYEIVDYPASMINKGKPYGATTQAYIEGYNNLQAQFPDKKIIFTDQFEKATEMVDGLFNPTWNHPSLKAWRTLFEKGQPEVSYFINDFVDGVNIKFRPDLDGENYFLDYKTTSDTLADFANTIAKYGYDISAAMYLEGKLETNRELFQTEKDIKMYWLVQEVNPPYDWAIFSAEYILPDGINKFYELLAIYKNCLETKEYGGYASMSQDSMGIFFPKLPNWKKTINNFLQNA